MTDPNREKLRIPLAAKQKIVPTRVKKRIKELVSLKQRTSKSETSSVTNP